jgi:hypothetical protein
MCTKAKAGVASAAAVAREIIVPMKNTSKNYVPLYSQVEASKKCFTRSKKEKMVFFSVDDVIVLYVAG